MTPPPSDLPAVPGEEESGFEQAASMLEHGIRGIEGGVRVEIVKRMRAMVDKNPEAFVRGMRHFLHDGRENE